MTFNLPPWIPERDPLRLALLGKLLEELGELTQIAARCVLQGEGGIDPDTGAINVYELQKEIADVYASSGLVLEHFDLYGEEFETRIQHKRAHLRQWHAKLAPTTGVDLASARDWTVYRCTCGFVPRNREHLQEHIREEHGA